MTQKTSNKKASQKSIPLLTKILLYFVSAIFFTIGVFGFMQISWLVSKPLSDDARTELAMKVKVPKDARAYNINHGNYIFFKETPRDNPKKTITILLMLLGGIGSSMSINIYLILKKRKFQKERK
jgi:hypothetical protein